MSDFVFYSLIMLVSVFISSISQVGLKKASQKQYKNIIREYLNPLVIISYGLFFLSTLLTVFALRGIPLSFAPILESAGYVFVCVLSFFVLKEKFSKLKIIGIVLILTGIAVYALF